MDRRTFIRLTAAGGLWAAATPGRPALAMSPKRLTPEQFGAVGNGAASDKLAWARLLHQVHELGGGVEILCNPAATYAFDASSWSFPADGKTSTFAIAGAEAPFSDNYLVWVDFVTQRAGADFAVDIGTGTITFTSPPPAGAQVKMAESLLIRASNVTVDGGGCGFTGNARFVVDGDPQRNGGEPGVENVHIRNFRLRSLGSRGCPKGPMFQWCKNSSMDSISKQGTTGTAFNIHMSSACTARNLSCIGNDDGFAFLFFHTTGCLLDGLAASDDDSGKTFAALVQVKGGHRNTVRNVAARDIRGSGDPRSPSTYGLFTRGDAPYRKTHAQGTYPFADGSWDGSDPRRETREVVWENCALVNCGFGCAFQAQEFNGCRVLNCRSSNSGDWKANRTPGGQEQNIEFHDLSITGARDRALECLGSGPAELLAGVKVIGLRVDGTTGPTGYAVRLRYCDEPLMQRFDIRNCPADPSVLVVSCRHPRILSGQVSDGGGAAMEITSSDVECLPVVDSVSGSGNRIPGFRISCPGQLTNLRG